MGLVNWIVELDQDGYADRRLVFEQIRSRFDLAASVDSLLADYRSRIIELTALTPGATECLRELRSAGHIIAIVTNGSSVQQHAKIDVLGLRSSVDVVVVSEDVGIKKPDRRIFDIAASETGTTLAHAWMVGDSPLLDIEAADRLGVLTAWLHRGRSWSGQDSVPTVTLESLHDLPTAVLSIETPTSCPERPPS